MNKNCTSISVNIDLRDDFEKSLLEYVEKQTNKSRFIKRLIFAHMMNIQTAKESTITTHEETNEDKEAMAGFF